MTKLGRQVYRNQAKTAYKKFKESWRARAMPDGRVYREGDDQFKRPLRCPTFSEWLKLHEAAMADIRKKQREQEAKVEVPELKEEDLEWA